MNVRLEDNEKKNKSLKIFYISIVVICVIAIITAVVIQIIKENSNRNTIDDNKLQEYKAKFNSVFQNKINYLENNNYKITKVDNSKEIVYVGYEEKKSKVSDYNLNVCIPYINIDNEVIRKYNNEIKDVFEQTAKDVLNSRNQNIVYTVTYSAYVTNNILSLVIRSTLKQGENPQRDMVQTYNYDLTNKKECTFEDMLNLKKISRQQANSTILSEIKKVEKQVNERAELGYSVYKRNSSDSMYNVDNITEFFLGEDDVLYVIFAYGNQNQTNEMDIVVM